MPILFDKIDIPNETTVYHTGPPLSLGPLPSLFYFSLSGEESLILDPFNQPVVTLQEHLIRVFSLTLPFHHETYPHKNAIKDWANCIHFSNNLVEEFVLQAMNAITFLINKKYILAEKLGVAGLSRGAFLATHLAAKDERISTILGFAPLTTLETIKDFEHLKNNPLTKELSLEHSIPLLINKNLRFYIGNHDTLVNTSRCFSFIQLLAEHGYQKKHRFIPIELMIYPSIGHKGHGTPLEIFTSGANWMANCLLKK